MTFEMYLEQPGATVAGQDDKYSELWYNIIMLFKGNEISRNLTPLWGKNILLNTSSMWQYENIIINQYYYILGTCIRLDTIQSRI